MEKSEYKVLFQRINNKLYAFFTFDNQVYWAKVTDKTLKWDKESELIFLDTVKARKKSRKKKKAA